MDNSYQQKYLKYKSKYEMAKKQQRGRRRPYVNELEGGIPAWDNFKCNVISKNTEQCKIEAAAKQQIIANQERELKIFNLGRAINTNGSEQNRITQEIQTKVDLLNNLYDQIKAQMETFRQYALRQTFVPDTTITNNFKNVINALNVDALIKSGKNVFTVANKKIFAEDKPYKKETSGIINNVNGIISGINSEYDKVQVLIDKYVRNEKEIISQQKELDILRSNREKDVKELALLDPTATVLGVPAQMNQQAQADAPVPDWVPYPPPAPPVPLMGGKRRTRTR
jgi:hypothetical protein